MTCEEVERLMAYHVPFSPHAGESRLELGFGVLAVQQHTDSMHAYPGDDSYEAALQRLLKKAKRKWMVDMKPVFETACVEQMDLAMKVANILRGTMDGWSLETCMIVDLSDLCLRGLKERVSCSSTDNDTQLSKRDNEVDGSNIASAYIGD